MVDASLSHGDSHVEEEENYFISMTDMMVGVLFIFIILLMVFAQNFRQQTNKSQQRIEELKKVEATAKQVSNKLDALQQRIDTEITALRDADKVRATLLQDVKNALEKADRDIVVVVDNATGALRFDRNAIEFESDKDQLNAVAVERVNLLADVLIQVLPRYTSGDAKHEATLETIFVEGHADKTGDPDKNWTLSTQRAVSTFRQLTLSQPSLSDLLNYRDQRVLSVAGYGATRPIANASNDAQRRIEMRFVMSTDSQKRLTEIKELTDKMQDELGELRGRLDEVGVR